MKTALYVILGICIIGGLTYAAGEGGLLEGLLVAFGVGANKGVEVLKKKAQGLDERARELNENLDEIAKAKEKLEKDGVKDMTPEEEAEYWKNQ